MDSEKRAVKEIIDSKHFKDLSKPTIVRITKNNDISEKIRLFGNKLFNNRYHTSQIHEDIWKYYSMSAASAESDSETLALSYSNRSAILLHMTKFRESIVDIDRSLDITKSDCLRVKLLFRKVRCLHALNDDEALNVLKEAKETVERVTVPALRETFEKGIKPLEFLLKLPLHYNKPEDKKTKLLNELEKKHPLNDFSSVEIQSNNKYGRYLTASRDIKPGEVIYVEEPYIQCLNIKKLHAYCSHCFKTTWTNIACDNCSWTMYCSEECKKEAWQKYHDIECSVYACAKDDNGNDASKQMAIKAMILALKEYGSVKKLEAQLAKWDESTDKKEAFMVDGKVKGNGFKSLYMMSGHVTPKYFKKLKKDTAMVLRSLGKNTSFFGNKFDYVNVESYKNNDNVLVLGALFLRLIKICELNSFQMWNNSYDCRSRFTLNFMCWANECCTRGVYIAPVTSLINHSCNPNAIRCYSNNHKIILYAAQPIKKGSQIFHSYQEIYYKCQKNLRRDYLSHLYNFSCDCAACQEDWPEWKAIMKSTDFSSQGFEDLFSTSDASMIKSILSGLQKYDENSIGKLAMGVEKSLEFLRQPASYTVRFVQSLSAAFEEVYGISLKVSGECYPSS